MAVDTPSIRYENPAPKVARIWLDRADARNAQDTKLLYELNDAFDRAAQDDDISVIVLAAEGPHFSSGHDLRERGGLAVMRSRRTVGTWCGFGCAGAEAQMAREKEIYLGFCERWRNIPKPTIAAVQGKVIAGGLMLVWPCDIIVAADNAEFIDNTVAMGVCGAEFFHHPWEVGDPAGQGDALHVRCGLGRRRPPPRDGQPRRGRSTSCSRSRWRSPTKIAQRPLFALKMTKEAVNAAQDNQGRVQAMQTSFALHQLCHSHNQQVHGMPIDPELPDGDGQEPVVT